MRETDFINMEYEARAMISEEQYQAIINYYSKVKTAKKYSTNFNTYFDYENLYLTNHHIVLRTRAIDNDSYELTLKSKGVEGDIEYNHILTLDEYNKMREKSIISDCQVKEELIKLGIEPKKLKVIADLRTERLEIQYKKYLLVIDKNYFRNRVDYNVEIESFSKKAAQKYLFKRFYKFGVTYKKGYVSKSKRAIFDL